MECIALRSSSTSPLGNCSRFDEKKLQSVEADSLKRDGLGLCTTKILMLDLYIGCENGCLDKTDQQRKISYCAKD